MKKIISFKTFNNQNILNESVFGLIIGVGIFYLKIKLLIALIKYVKKQIRIKKILNRVSDPERRDELRKELSLLNNKQLKVKNKYQLQLIKIKKHEINKDETMTLEEREKYQNKMIKLKDKAESLRKKYEGYLAEYKTL